jgi:S1-C subfamily serine protease
MPVPVRVRLMLPQSVGGKLETLHRVAVLLAMLLLNACAAIGSVPIADAQDGIPTLAPMIEKVLPGIVSVTAQGLRSKEEMTLLADPLFRRLFGLPKRPQPEEREFQTVGSGIIIDATKGYIATANHVIADADRITVVLNDAQRLDARLVGTDPVKDVAVIQVNAKGLVAVPIGDSDRLRVGDYVVAIGNPFGLGQTATLGIVSGLGRKDPGKNEEPLIQTDVSINPGSSGGALVNLRGEVVGINSIIIGTLGGNTGIGFAIPITMAKRVLDVLVRHDAPQSEQ